MATRKDDDATRLAKTYQKKTTREQILHRPTMWADDDKQHEEYMWVKDPEKDAIVMEKIRYTPALYKIFDESIVNASDRLENKLKTLCVNYNPEDGYIQVINDGEPLPVAMHKDEKIMIPEMVFGHLNSSSNYNDGQNRTTGGCNGVGIKLTNTFSLRLQVCSVDADRKKVSWNEWRNNMAAMTHAEVMSLPKARGLIKQLAALPPQPIGDDAFDLDKVLSWKYSMIPARGSQVTLTYWPDFKRLDTPDGLHNRAFQGLIEKRVWDMAGLLGDRGVKVYLNGRCLTDTIPNFPAYAGLYSPEWAADVSAFADDKPPAAATDDLHEDATADVAMEGLPEAEVAATATTAVTEEAAETASVTSATGAKRLTKAQKLKAQLSQQRLWSLKTAGGAAVILGVANRNSKTSEKNKHCISFVNGIHTSDGGIHTKLIQKQILRAVEKAFSDKKSESLGARDLPFELARNVAMFVDCRLPDPNFDTQCKKRLLRTAWDSEQLKKAMKLPDSALAMFLRQSQLVSVVKSFLSDRMMDELAKTSGKKTCKITGIPKLDDANNAGTALSSKCTLILTEGDSAKALAVAGVSVLGRDNYGVFPLRGKVLNVRDAAEKKILANAEIQNIVKIMGLQYGEKYTSTEGLRYGSIMIMADQDHDGSHIKGLVISLMDHFWPELLQIKGFLEVFITPIVKLTKGKLQHVFYSLPDYHAWLRDNNNGKGWKPKYYKGLGTSTTDEAKVYFRALERHRLRFKAPLQEDTAALGLAFDKDRADDRETWLQTLGPAAMDNPPDFSVKEMSYLEFVNKELIQFSMADNLRSIPHVCDGFKPSQRKVLFAALKKDLKNDLKVAQFAGYVSEHSAYHHNEQSLADTIVKMAQDFLGSNNVNLLYPSGQFGTRLMGGKDAASTRYIFTRLQPVAKLFFRKEDDPALKFLDEEGMSIEPQYYLPVLSMLAINGSAGIGTGWSTFIPPHDAMDVLRWTRARLENKQASLAPLAPSFLGFQGRVVEAKPQTYRTIGCAEFVDSPRAPSTQEILVSELPIGEWTTDYKVKLESLMGSKTKLTMPSGFKVSKEYLPQLNAMWKGFQEFRENHTTLCVRFSLVFSRSGIAAAKSLPHDELLSALGLQSTIHTSNMHAFNAAGVITKYDTVEDLLEDHFQQRLAAYSIRKKQLLQSYRDSASKATEKAKFIRAVMQGSLIITKRQESDVVRDMEAMGFLKIGAGEADADNDAADDPMDGASASGTKSTKHGYEHLLSMSLVRLTENRFQELQAEADKMQQALQSLQQKSECDLWREDLDAVEKELLKMKRQRMKTIEEELHAQPTASNTKKKKRAAKSPRGAAASTTSRKRTTGDATGARKRTRVVPQGSQFTSPK